MTTARAPVLAGAAAPPARVHGDQLAGAGVADFAVNVWPGERPAPLEAALRHAVLGRRYPDQRAARTALAECHGRTAAEVLPANGACELFWLVAHALRPRLAACIHPSFTEPEAALRAAGTPVLRVPRRPGTWALDLAAVPEAADLVVLGSPNNPTGTLDDPDAIRALCRPGRLVLVDESFMDFVAGGDAVSLAHRRVAGLAVVRSLTKLWALPGVRAGHLLGEPALVARLDGARQPWSVNAAALAAMCVCAGDAGTPRAVAAQVATARARLHEGLAARGLRTWPSAANFVLAHHPRGAALAARLRGQRVAVRPAGDFPGLTADHLRIAVRPVADQRVLLAALDTVGCA